MEMEMERAKMAQAPFKKASEVEGSGYEGPSMADLIGETLLIKPKSYDENLPGKFVDKETGQVSTYDRVVADIVVINTRKPEKSELHEGMHITQGWIIGKTKGEIGQMILGVLHRGKGATDPYMLDDPDDDDVDAATKFLEGAGDEPPF